MLWHLTRKTPSDGYNIAEEFVVRASTEMMARMLASKDCGGEGPDFWLDDSKTSCRILMQGGRSQVVIRDFSAG